MKILKTKTDKNVLKKKTFKQSRNWCFTDFKLLDFNKIWNEYRDIIRYICVGEEICPKTKKKHYQGWIQFVNKKRMSRVKNILNSKEIHLEPCRGNEIDNNKYCQKEGKHSTFGKYIIQGQRTDLEEIKKMIDNSVPMLEVANNYFSDYIRYFRGLERYQEMVQKNKTKMFRKIKTTLIMGPTGCGKTRKAVESCSSYYKITGSSLKWFDGYDGEKTLIIDEYANDLKITTLLNILDGYQLRLPVKGGFTYANWTRVFITTNLKELHSKANLAHQDALFRRIDECDNMWITDASMIR